MSRLKAGPSQLVKRVGYTTTASLSILQKMLAGKALRTGYGIEALRVGGIESRRRERIFGATGTGRSKGLSTGIKIEKLGADYDPLVDKPDHLTAVPLLSPLHQHRLLLLTLLCEVLLFSIIASIILVMLIVATVWPCCISAVGAGGCGGL